VLTAGTYGNVLRFLPPLVMPGHLLDEGLGILEDAFAGLESPQPQPQAPSAVVATPA
jgi:acetylornithine/succinyldiaminopimelate/putrescine aminotransferase